VRWFLANPRFAFGGLVVLLNAGVVMWVWSPVLDSYFYADDFMYLLGTQTPGVLRASLLPGGTDLIWVYRPLASFGYYWIVRSLFGLDPTVFHLSSLLVHIANATLVAWLASRFGCSRLASLFASLIYATHVAHFHGLVTPATFQEVLATFFVFSALALYLRQDAVPPGSWLLPILTVLFFGAALLSKESALSFPLLLTWLEAVRSSSSPRSDTLWRRCRRTLPFFAIAGMYGAFLYVSGGFARGDSYALVFDASVLRRLQQYLTWALEPSVWGLPFESTVSLVLFAGLLMTVWRWRQTWSGVGWFFLSLLPVAFLPYRMAPNYVMVGLFGLCLVVGVAVDRGVLVLLRLSRRLAPPIAIIALGIVVYFGATRARRLHEAELQDGWTGRTERLARCVASHVLARYPAGLPASIAIFRGFDGHEKWVLWGGAILNVVYETPSIRSLFVPDPRLGPSHPLFSHQGPPGNGHVSIHRQEIESCLISASPEAS
jgi:hypothetical protein